MASPWFNILNLNSTKANNQTTYLSAWTKNANGDWIWIWTHTHTCHIPRFKDLEFWIPAFRPSEITLCRNICIYIYPKNMMLDCSHIIDTSVYYIYMYNIHICTHTQSSFFPLFPSEPSQDPEPQRRGSDDGAWRFWRQFTLEPRQPGEPGKLDSENLAYYTYIYIYTVTN